MPIMCQYGLLEAGATVGDMYHAKVPYRSNGDHMDCPLNPVVTGL